MESDIHIHDLRLTFLWVDTVLNLLQCEGRVPSDAHLSCMASEANFRQTFESLRLGQPAPEPTLQLPWVPGRKSFFWSYYTARPRIQDLAGGQAWSLMVPFRLRLASPIDPDAHLNLAYAAAETFFYPFGFVFALSLSLRGDFALTEAVERALELKRAHVYRLPSIDGEPVVEDNLSQARFVDELRANLRAWAFGRKVEADAQTIRPFSVVTVVRGEGVNPGIPVAEDGMVHRALDAWTTWSPSWEYNTLSPLTDAVVPLRHQAPPSHLLYGADAGRVVWFPAAFRPQWRPLHTLACYHKNLVQLSIQIASMGQLSGVVAPWIETGQGIPPRLNTCAHKVAGILGRLYGAHKDTYRSWSSSRQIHDSGWIPDINILRHNYSMPPLSS